MPMEAMQPTKMLLWKKILGGTVASSLRHAWAPMNAIPNTPDSTNSAMIRPLSHAYRVPPQLRASTNETAAGATRMKPNGSSCLIFPSQDFAGLIEGGVLGTRKKSTTSDIAPMGTLIQKHQRQVTAVRYPPSKGPSIEASPKMAPKPPALG